MERGRRQMVISSYDENPFSSLYPFRRSKSRPSLGLLPKKGIVERPWPTSLKRKEGDHGDGEQPRLLEQQQQPAIMGSPRVISQVDDLQERRQSLPAVTAPSTVSRKKLKLTGLIEKGRIIRATPSPAQRRWRAVLCTPLSSSCPSTTQCSTAIVVNAKRRKVSNPLVDLLRSRIEGESAEISRISLLEGDMDSFSSMGEGYQTPRSAMGDVGRSPPPVARSTGARSRMETPVSAARVRIQSPAPARTPLADRVEFMLS